MFAFAAKTTAWPDDANPPSANDITQSTFDSDIVFLKALDGNNMRLMVSGTTWTAKTYTKDTFVRTADNLVFRCSTAGTSGKEPVHQSGIAPDQTGTASWEFVEKLTYEDISSYLITNFIPLSLVSERFLYQGLVKSFGVSFDLVGNEDGFLPFTTNFRVVGLYANPYDRYERTNTSDHKTTVKNFGYVLTWTTLPLTSRTSEQIDSYTFFIALN